jgi:hypothetical protein
MASCGPDATLRPDQADHAAHQLDDTFGKTNSHMLRWFYLDLIKEYSRHLGHPICCANASTG